VISPAQRYKEENVPITLPLTTRSKPLIMVKPSSALHSKHTCLTFSAADLPLIRPLVQAPPRPPRTEGEPASGERERGRQSVATAAACAKRAPAPAAAAASARCKGHMRASPVRFSPSPKGAKCVHHRSLLPRPPFSSLLCSRPTLSLYVDSLVVVLSRPLSRLGCLVERPDPCEYI